STSATCGLKTSTEGSIVDDTCNPCPRTLLLPMSPTAQLMFVVEYSRLPVPRTTLGVQLRSLRVLGSVQPKEVQCATSYGERRRSGQESEGGRRRQRCAFARA